MADQPNPMGAPDAPQQPQDAPQQPVPQPAQPPAGQPGGQPATQTDQSQDAPQQPAQPQEAAPQEPMDATTVQPQPTGVPGAAPADAAPAQPQPTGVPGAAPMDATQVASGVGAPAPGGSGAPADAQAAAPGVPNGPAVPDAYAAPGAPAPKKPMSKGLLAAIIAVVVVLVGGGIFLLVRNNVAQQAEAKIKDTASSIVEADDSLHGLDAYAKIDSGFDTDLDTDGDRNKVSDATSALDTAEASLNEAKQSEWALSDADKSTITALEAGIQSRRDATDTVGKLMDATDQAKTVSDDASTFLNDFAAAYVYLGLADDARGQAISSANNGGGMDTSAISTYLDKCSSALEQAKKDLDALEQDAPDADFSSYDDVCDALSTTVDDLSAAIDKMNQGDVDGTNAALGTYYSQRDDLVKKAKGMEGTSAVLKKLVTDGDKQNAKNLKSNFSDIKGNVSDLIDDELVGDTMDTSTFA